MEENWTVDISLVACKESSFDAHLDSNMEIDVNYIYFGYEFEINKTGVDSIRIDFAGRYSSGRDETLIRLVTSVEFQILNMEKLLLFTKNGSIKDPTHIIAPLLVVSYGAMRGMMATKTAGTPLEKFPVPLLSQSELYRTFLEGEDF